MKPAIRLTPSRHPFPILRHSPRSHDLASDLRFLASVCDRSPSSTVVELTARRGLRDRGLWLQFEDLFAVHLPGPREGSPFAVEGRSVIEFEGKVVHVIGDGIEPSLRRLAAHVGMMVAPGLARGVIPLGPIDVSFESVPLPSDPCPDCKGTGVYVGFTSQGPCLTCSTPKR